MRETATLSQDAGLVLGNRLPPRRLGADSGERLNVAASPERIA